MDRSCGYILCLWDRDDSAPLLPLLAGSYNRLTMAGKAKNIIAAISDLVGPENVLHAPEDMLVFEYDASIDKAIPQAVVLPLNPEQISSIVKLANTYGIPITPRGAGTGLSGGALAVKGGIVIGTSRMNRILEIDPINQVAVVEPGLVNIKLSEQAAAHGLHYVPDPSSQKACTIGGNVAENSGGPHCLAYGVTSNHVLGMEVVTPDGELVWLGSKSQDRPGYDLPGIFVGSEGTIGIVTKVIVKLTRDPESIGTMLAVFDQMDQATTAVSSVIASGIVPAAIEMIDRVAIEAVNPSVNAGFPDDADAVLLVEVDGLRETVAEELNLVQTICHEIGVREVRVAKTAEERNFLWSARKGAFGALGRIAPNYYVLDGVVPRTKLPETLRRVTEIGNRFNFRIANVFHAGDGNLHPCIAFDERIPGESRRVLEAGAQVMSVCIELGGSITGEHGVGLEKQDFMGLVFSEADLNAQEKLKAAFGESETFNPCKVFPSRAGCGEGWRLPKMPDLNPDVYI